MSLLWLASLLLSSAIMTRALPQGPSPLPPRTPKHGAPRPNIILFVIDDMGWSNIGYHNNNSITPNLDNEATQGIILERHYAFRWCAPTRSALMTGRMPYRVLQQTDYVSGGMNMLPAKLKQVGYRTHQIGKWHLGSLMSWMTPHGRGFDSSFGYLGGAEDHYLHTNSESGCKGVDLFETDRVANRSWDGMYSSHMYNHHMKAVIKDHAKQSPGSPLFMYVALQDMHAPNEVPGAYTNRFNKYTTDFAAYNGMGTAADDVFGNLTSILKEKGLYNDTLIVVVSDNGGPPAMYVSGHMGNNWPLRGGKQTDFEGGIRTVSFVGGGFVSPQAKGAVRNQYAHAADWYPTLCRLAGGDDCFDSTAVKERSVPSVDGFDLWPYLSGVNQTSPRTEIMVARCQVPTKDDPPVSKGSPNCSGAIIQGKYKLIIGMQGYAFWQGPVYPNRSTTTAARKRFEQFFDCGKGCLFNIHEDPAETNDLSLAMPQKLQELWSRYKELNATQFDAPRLPPDPQACEHYVAAHNGSIGPYME